MHLPRLASLRSLLLIGLLGLTAPAMAVPHQNLGTSVAACDFNRDGYMDLATGAPGASFGTTLGAGRVDVIYGRASGLDTSTPKPGVPSAVPPRQSWDQSKLGALRSIQANAGFGRALATGDFNGDGYCDLAVGTREFDLGSLVNAGVVEILYGSPNGLIAVGVPGVPDAATTGQRFSDDHPLYASGDLLYNYFGSALAAGDFNHDGYADLAVGTNTGLVHVLYGTAAGLQVTAPKRQYFGDTSVKESFGYALTTGDFNRDGYADLAVGSPTAVDQSIANAGRVDVLYGGAAGLTTAGRQKWSKYTLFNQGTAAYDRFGAALAAGDFDGDGDDDLAIGIPGDSSPIASASGAIAVVRGSINGLSTLGAQFFSQDTNGIADTREYGDLFGYSLVAGNFNGDRFADLAVGAPGDKYGTGAGAVPLAGFVNVIYGSTIGLTGVSGVTSQGFEQHTGGVLGDPVLMDRFGAALAAGDFNGDGRTDLAIGVPEDDIDPTQNTTDEGAVNVLYGWSTGITTAGNQLIR